MRKILLIMATIFSLTAVGQVNMTVYLSNGEVKVYDKADVDSVTFGMSGDTDKYNGYEYVDLGLPSGLKWATCNIGADAPEKYGDFYEWAETEPRDRYGKGNKHSSDGSSLKYSKYNKDDNKTLLDPEDDVAHVVWGGTWRMPTDEEHKELRRNCKWEDTTLNGVNVTKITGPNGNCIYLPYNGRRMYDDFMELDKTGYYWTSSLVTKGNSWMKYFCSFASYFSVPYAFGNMLRDFGAAVRPVTE